jgi:hypothetical protein
MHEGTYSVLEAKRTKFSNRFGMRLFKDLFISELGTCSQNFMPTRDVEPCEKHQFPQWSMLKFIYNGTFLTTKKAYEKFLY